jgi:hypothetical protein
MPRPVNYLNHEDCPAESDGFGWEQRPGTTYDVPVWMERMGMLDLPEWMRTEDGSCDVNYTSSMGTDKPEIYTTSLSEISPDEPQLPKREQCRFFARHGRCKFGEHCYFSHDMNTDDESKKSGWIKEKDCKKSWEERAREAREKREDEEGKKVRVCRFYGTDEGCKKGVFCMNRHID